MAVTRSYDWGNIARDSGFRSRRDGALKWWMMLAIILSFAFHGVLIWCFENLDWAGSSATQRVIERAPLERFKINPELLKQQDTIREIPKDLIDAKKPDLESFKPDLDAYEKASMIPLNQEIDLSPNVAEIKNLVRATAPEQMKGNAGSGASRLAQMMEVTASSAGPSAADVASAMAAVKSSVLSKPVSAKQMVLDTAPKGSADAKIGMELLEALGDGSKGNSAAGAKVKGFSNLDDLLSGGGQVGGSTDPILMPTDLLFEFGSDQLADKARLSMMKLGFLIQKNPNSVFIIEGHTDTIGTEEDNLALSQRRANAVVDWLQRSLRLTSERIRAEGLGETDPIRNREGSQEEQAINRRVEIKVRPRK
jgi:outer membrane protein OmpA-like peptidoglycan-associated protein